MNRSEHQKNRVISHTCAMCTRFMASLEKLYNFCINNYYIKPTGHPTMLWFALSSIRVWAILNSFRYLWPGHFIVKQWVGISLTWLLKPLLCCSIIQWTQKPPCSTPLKYPPSVFQYIILRVVYGKMTVSSILWSHFQFAIASIS